MTFSTQRATSDGTLSILDLTIEYIDQIDVHLFVDDVEMDLTGGTTPYTWEWVTPSKIKILPVIPNGSVVMLRRRTPSSEMYHNFDAGAVFKDATVDENFKQVLFLTQESQEGLALTDLFNDLDMHGFDILNLPDATNPQSPVTLAQLNTYVVDSAAALRQDLAATGGAERVGRGAGNVETALDALEADVAALQLVSAEYVRPQDFGAVGDGVANDTAAVRATIQDGRPIYWGDDSKVYRTAAMISHTLSRAAVWISNGATIKVDSPSAIQRAINITSPGYDFYSSGKLSIDCNLKSYSGLYLSNATSFADCRIDDIFVRNVYRSGKTFTGGDGILIRGAFRNVLLVRPDVRNVRMATGAGIIGSQGISGITVSSAGPGLAPQEVTILHPYVAGVLSEDVAYKMDQDGIRVFTEEDIPEVTQTFDSHFTMVGGKFLNCRGRSVKSQCEHGSIVGTHFVRDSSLEPLMSGAGDLPEIDFQVGGGMVSNIECRYRSSVPARVFTLSGTRTAGKLGTGANISGVRLVLTGGVDLARFAEINMFESLSALYVIRDVSYSGIRNFGSHFVQVSTPLDRTVLLTLENIAARITSDFRYVRKSEATGTVNAVGRNIRNLSNTTVFGSSAGGTLTTLLEGINMSVSL